MPALSVNRVLLRYNRGQLYSSIWSAILSGHHDIFICHDQASANSAKRLASALAARGISCHTHEGDSTGELSHKLPISKVFLVYASEGFFESRGCQTHLTMAWLAAKRDPHTRSRLLVINPEPGSRHIYPLFLKDLTIADGSETHDFSSLAGLIQQKTAEITGDLGDFFPTRESLRFGPYDGTETRIHLFGGRHREIWDIHRALHESDSQNASPHSFVVLSGNPGFGKTLTALEYAHRFSAAYPGGIYRISAREAVPQAKFSQLSVNPPLKPQLLEILQRLQPEDDHSDRSSLHEIREALATRIGNGEGDYLWIVDDFPEGINGPVLQQWLAPAGEPAKPGRGHTIVISESQRYDSRGDPIHLPLLSETAGQVVLTRGHLPTRAEEKDSLNWLTDEIGRHPRFAGIAAGTLEAEKQDRRSTLARLTQRISRRNRSASDIALQWSREFPEAREKAAANLLLDAIQDLHGAARDIMRLAVELENHPIPLNLVTQSLILAGMSADDRKEDLFTIFLNEPEEIPLTPEEAASYVEQGAAELSSRGLALVSADFLTIPNIVLRAYTKLAATSPRQTLLAEGCLQALYVIAESAQKAMRMNALSHVAPHTRKLVGDLRDRIISQEDNASEITGRIRLALYSADLDLLHGAKDRATGMYRAASAYLVRAMASDPHNVTRQKDFARAQEQLGDLVAESGNFQAALDHYRKSLGIRAFMSKQDGAPTDSVQDALRLNNKISRLQRKQGDAEAALQTQETSHTLYIKRFEIHPENMEFEFDIASSHAQLGELHIKLNNPEEGLKELKKALPIFERLSENNHDDLRYARAPGAIHNRIGDILHARDDLSGALQRYKTALSTAEKLANQFPDDPEILRDLAICHDNLGDTLSGLDDSQEADHHFKAFLEIAESPKTRAAFFGKRMREISAVHIKLGRSRETEKMHRLALERYLQARGLIEKLAIDYPDYQPLREDLQWLRHKISRLTERLEADDRRIARNRANIPENPEAAGPIDWQGNL